MDLNKLNKEMNSLPEEIREAILNIINQKTNSDMDRFISELKSFKSELEAQQSNSDSQLRMMRWVIGIVGGVLAIILTILALK